MHDDLSDIAHLVVVGKSDHVFGVALSFLNGDEGTCAWCDFA
jgi:hypothetical protein